MFRIFSVALLCLVHLPAAARASDVESQSLAPAVAAGEKLPRLHSLLVSQHGKILIEHYFHGTRPTDFANMKSASKSVISALIGIALDRKLIPSIATPIANWFPELAAPGADPQKRRITIQDLLTMRSGLVETNRGYGAWVGSPNWVRYLLSRPLQFPPGEEMNYNTGNTHLLSAILTKVSGASTWEFLQKSLAAPLGITVPRWQQDPQGIFFGGNNMLMTPLQMLRFGELYLRGGRYQGRQIVPEQWVEQSFIARTQSPISGEQYGYGWWIREFPGGTSTPIIVEFAWGFGGQYIFVAPSLDMVIVTTSSDAVTARADDKQLRRDYRNELFDLIGKQVLTAVDAKPNCVAAAMHVC